MANGMTDICVVKESKYSETLVDTIPNEYIFRNNSFDLPCQPPQVQCIFTRLIQLSYYVLFPGSRKDCTNEISLCSIRILQTRPQNWPHIPLFKYTCPHFLKMLLLHCIKRSEHFVQVSERRDGKPFSPDIIRNPPRQIQLTVNNAVGRVFWYVPLLLDVRDG